jgi:hypothetical protein
MTEEGRGVGAAAAAATPHLTPPSVADQPDEQHANQRWPMAALEEFGRTSLSAGFFMRDFLYSEVAAVHSLLNAPDDPELAIAAGRRLCEELLEPLQDVFGRIAVRSGYRSCAVNDLGYRVYRRCAANEKNHARHIWDRRDAKGRMGATACIVVPWFIERYQVEGDWQRLAWWIHDHLPYSRLCFYPKLFAFNLAWHETPARTITSFAEPKGLLAAPWLPTPQRTDSADYSGFPKTQAAT